MATLATVARIPGSIGRFGTCPVRSSINHPSSVFNTKNEKRWNNCSGDMFQSSFTPGSLGLSSKSRNLASVTAASATSVSDSAEKLRRDLGGVAVREQSSAEEMQNWVEEIRRKFRSLHEGNAGSHTHSVELSKRLWIIDRVERLGIGRYFEKEIKESLAYIHRYFTEPSASWTKKTSMQDLSNTAIGFRLLRQHGFDISENVFELFKTEDGEFTCFADKTSKAVSALFNLYVAAQMRFPGDSILADASSFARAFLQAEIAGNEDYNTYIIPKDLAGEVQYALSTTWYSSVPMVQIAYYLKNYVPDDTWIDEGLSKLPFFNSKTILALAKADYNMCQEIRQTEIPDFLRWNEECNFHTLTFPRHSTYESFLGATLMFPALELSKVRVAFAKISVLIHVVDDLFDGGGDMVDMEKFVLATTEWDPDLMDGASEEAKISFYGFHKSINEMIHESSIMQHADIGASFLEYCKIFVKAAAKEAEWVASKHKPSMDEYLKVGGPSFATDMSLFGGFVLLQEQIPHKLTSDPAFQRMSYLSGNAGRLLNDIQSYKRDRPGEPNAVNVLMHENPNWTDKQTISHIKAMIQGYMQELVEIVYVPSHIPQVIKEGYYDMVKCSLLYYGGADINYWNSRNFGTLMRDMLFVPVPLTGESVKN